MGKRSVSSLNVRIGGDAKDLTSTFNKANFQLQKFSNSVNRIGGMLAGYLAFTSITEAAGDVVRLTGEFQKFDAVLSNTLGSNTKAKKSMKEIMEFAANTPFQVNELTESYVKLANQGFIPTMKEMENLGDLAASTGKSFDQLAEAILDAQTGEFERLKEFGVRAKKEGDKVTFTFKGLETQVDFTAASIQQYILGLGELNGVKGSTAAISQTLTGRISNLKDTYDQFLISIGQKSSGPLFSFIGFLNDAILGVQTLGARFEMFKLAINPFKDLSDASKELLDTILTLGETDSGRKVADVLQPIKDISDGEFFENLTKIKKEFVGLLTAEGESIADANVLWKHYFETRRSGLTTLNEIIQRNLQKQREEIEQLNQLLKQQSAVFSATVSPSFDIPALDSGMQERMDNMLKTFKPLSFEADRLQKYLDELNASGMVFADQAGNAVINWASVARQALNDASIAFGEFLGKLAIGEATFKGFGDNILGALGSLAVEIGTIGIGIGVALLKFDTAISTLNPFLAIGAGVALVALGTALKGSYNKYSGGGSGGYASGSGASSSDSYRSPELGEVYGYLEVKVVGKIDNQSIALAAEKGLAKMKVTKGKG